MLYIWDPPIRNLSKIILRSFLYEGTISQKNQPEVSYKVVSILRVLLYVIFFALDSYCNSSITNLTDITFKISSLVCQIL